MSQIIKKHDYVDILEDLIPRELLSILLFDHTTSKNILWATDIGGHKETDPILIEDIVGENGLVLRPRVRKSEEERKLRTKKRAEVFTPSWVCNEQLNSADSLWFFGSSAPQCGSPFNKPRANNTWVSTSKESIRRAFKEAHKDWKQYVLEDRIEMCCGEGPYLTSRYDVVSEKEIAVKDRIGILDRKLMVVNAFVGIGRKKTKKEWLEWVIKAYQHTYGFEWQGDDLLLTREALLYTFLDIIKEYNASCSIRAKESGLSKEDVLSLDSDFLELEDFEYIKQICSIISWNIWQMDGLTGCPPYTKPQIEIKKLISIINKQKSSLFEGEKTVDIPKEFCMIMDWTENKITTYAEVYAEAVKSKTV